MNFIETQHFTNASGLKKWLAGFAEDELRKMTFFDADRLVVHVVQSVLSDGSAVYDLHMETK